MSPHPDLTLHFTYLGCPKNRVDSEAALQLLIRAGFVPVPEPEQARFFVVNTCSFLAAARAEAREVILRRLELRRRRADTRLAVLGCWVSLTGEQLRHELPGIDLLVGSEELERLPDLLLSSTLPPVSSAVSSAGTSAFSAGGHYLGPGLLGRVRTAGCAFAYLKINDGCDRSCAFCLIPMIKGPLTHRPAREILAEARGLADQGVRELVLVGQDPGSWRDEARRLPDLLRELAALEGIAWLRLLYLYPGRILLELAALMREEPKVVPYLDLPLQHLDDELLRLMRRGYTAVQARAWLEAVQRMVPGVFLRSSFIVGHPGEEERSFARLLAFVQEGHFHHLALFPFSDEVGTASHALPHRVPPEVIRARLRQLEQAQQKVVLRRGDALKGRTLPILIEQHPAEDGQLLLGRHWGQAPELDGATFVVPAQKLPERWPAPGSVVQGRIYSALQGNFWARLECADQ